MQLNARIAAIRSGSMSHGAMPPRPAARDTAPLGTMPRASQKPRALFWIWLAVFALDMGVACALATVSGSGSSGAAATSGPPATDYAAGY